jgi:hypothetical protein
MIPRTHTETSAALSLTRTAARLLAFAPLLLLSLAGCSAEEGGGTAAPFQEETVEQNAPLAATASPVRPFQVMTSAGNAGKVNGWKEPETAQAGRIRYLVGEDPAFARRKGWPVKQPDPLPGSILPGKRILAYYGNPLSKRMGALGEYRRDDMLARLRREVGRWEAADRSRPVQPALHLIAVVAQGSPGREGKYRLVMSDDLVNRVHGWAREANALLFLDIQTGHDNIRTILPRFERFLRNPDVHLGIDPEFNLIASRARPGTRIGTYDAADINYVSGYLAELVRKYKLPPKVLVVHRFTQSGVTNFRRIMLRPQVQIVVNMDGWGPPRLKRDTYRAYVVSEPVQFTGFKLFYHNDTKRGDPLLTPRELLRLSPQPLYIQYQ